MNQTLLKEEVEMMVGFSLRAAATSKGIVKEEQCDLICSGVRAGVIEKVKSRLASNLFTRRFEGEDFE